MERFSELWKAVPKESMFEHRLTCKLANERETAALLRTPAAKTPAPSKQQVRAGVMCSLVTTGLQAAAVGSEAIETLSGEVRQLRTENRVLLAAMLTLLFVLLFVIFHQRSVYQVRYPLYTSAADVVSPAGAVGPHRAEHCHVQEGDPRRAAAMTMQHIGAQLLPSAQFAPFTSTSHHHSPTTSFARMPPPIHCNDLTQNSICVNIVIS